MEGQSVQTTSPISPHLNNAVALAKVAATKAPSELERFSLLLGDQKDLLNSLYSRLDTVSQRQLEENVPKDRGDTQHLSTLLDILGENNENLRKMLSELIL